MKIKLSLIGILLLSNTLFAKQLPPGVAAVSKPNVLLTLDASGSMKYTNLFTIGDNVNILKTKNFIIAANKEDFYKDIKGTEIHKKYGSITFFNLFNDDGTLKDLTNIDIVDLNNNKDKIKQKIYVYETKDDKSTTKCRILNIQLLTDDNTDPHNNELIVLSDNPTGVKDVDGQCKKLTTFNFDDDSNFYKIHDEYYLDKQDLDGDGDLDDVKPKNLITYRLNDANWVLVTNGNEDNKGEQPEYLITYKYTDTLKYDNKINIDKANIVGLGTNKEDIVYITYDDMGKKVMWFDMISGKTGEKDFENDTRDKLLNVFRYKDDDYNKLIINTDRNDNDYHFLIYDLDSDDKLSSDGQKIVIIDDEDTMKHLDKPQNLSLVDNRLCFKSLRNDYIYSIKMRDLLDYASHNKNDDDAYEFYENEFDLTLGGEVKNEAKWISMIKVMNEVFNESDLSDKMNLGFTLWSDESTLNEKDGE
jgi:hypothetical protein